MSEKVTLKMDKDARDNFVHQLGYIRTWVQGFEAAGKAGPHSIDTLRLLQNHLKAAK